MAKTSTANKKNTMDAPAKSEAKAKVAVISVDNSIDEVLKLDDDGYVLRFESAKGRFLKLTDEAASKLSSMNAVAYGLSLGMHERDADNTEGRPIIETFQPANPRDRLAIDGKKSGMKYYWARPDKLTQHERAAGYRICQDGKVQTFSREHQVKAFGKTELVLMETTEENAAKAKAARKERSRTRMQRRELADRGGLSQYGAKFYDEDSDPKDSRRPWSGPKDEE